MLLINYFLIYYIYLIFNSFQYCCLFSCPLLLSEKILPHHLTKLISQASLDYIIRLISCGVLFSFFITLDNFSFNSFFLGLSFITYKFHIIFRLVFCFHYPWTLLFSGSNFSSDIWQPFICSRFLPQCYILLRGKKRNNYIKTS